MLNNFSVFFGDSYDGLIEISIFEHWYNFFECKEAFFSTRYFYPYAATIGYNDALLIPGLFFAAGRTAGFDIFVSALIAHVSMKIIGFFGMFVLLRLGGAIRFWLALAGSALFTISSASLLHMYHAQLLSVCLIPWLMVFALRAGRALLAGETGSLCLWGGMLGAGFGLAAFTAFYMAWFFAFGMMLYVAAALVTTGAQARSALWVALTRQWPAVVLCLLIALCALTPLGIAYLPKVMAGMHHDWTSGPADTLVNMGTLINVGDGNLVWGRLLDLAASASHHGLAGGEARFGIPLGLLVAGLVALAWFVRNRAGNAMPFVMAVALVGFVALMAKGPGGLTGWYYVYTWVPGASAIRVVARGLLLALVPLTFVVFTYLDRVGWSNTRLACVVAFLLIEQVQLHAPTHLDRRQQQQMLNEVGAPPRACQAIFVVSARTDDDKEKLEGKNITSSWAVNNDDRAEIERNANSDFLKYRHNVDAMLLSGYYHFYTINGFSTFNPIDWNFSDPRDPSYLERVRQYARNHGIKTLCGLDRNRQPHWFTVKVP